MEPFGYAWGCNCDRLDADRRGLTSWITELVSLVNTDFSCFERMSVWDRLSRNNLPFSLSGTTPVESSFLDLMKYQEGLVSCVSGPSWVVLLC